MARIESFEMEVNASLERLFSETPTVNASVPQKSVDAVNLRKTDFFIVFLSTHTVVISMQSRQG